MPNPMSLQTGIGTITVGDGITNQGIINVDEYPSADHAIRAALNLSKHIRILASPQPYMIENPLDITASGVTIEGDGAGNTVLTASNSEAYGVLHVTGDNVTLRDLSIASASAVADQVLVGIDGDAAKVTSCLFEITAEDATTANPMVMLQFAPADASTQDPAIVAVDKQVIGCSFRPAKGVVCLRANNGFHLKVDSCDFSSGSNSTTKCWRAIDLLLESKGTITGCTFHNLGDATDEIDALVYATSDSNENHHMVFSGNYVENISGPFVLKLLGARFWTITGNTFGKITKVDGAGNACIYLNDNDDDGSGTAGAANTIAGNQFHNTAASSGTAIYVGKSNDTTIAGNSFTIISAPQITAAGTLTGLTVSGNTFESSTNTSIIVASGTVTDLTVEGNTIRSSSTTALILYSGTVTFGSINGNVIQNGGAGAGISYTGTISNGAIVGNTIRVGTGGNAISIAPTSATSPCISGNTLNLSTGAGILLGGTAVAGANINGNSITITTGIGISVTGASVTFTNVTGNYITGTTGSCVTVNATAVTDLNIGNNNLSLGAAVPLTFTTAINRLRVFGNSIRATGARALTFGAVTFTDVFIGANLITGTATLLNSITAGNVERGIWDDTNDQAPTASGTATTMDDISTNWIT